MTEDQTLSRIASYCSKAERCESDVRNKLNFWGIELEIIDKLVVRLKKENFLNEERFCLSFIRDKVRFNKWGINKIVFELRKKNISKSLIESCVDSLQIGNEIEDSLMKILFVKSLSIKGKSDYEKRAKLYRFALSRGFSPDLIQKYLDKLLNSSSDGDFL